MPQGLVRPTGPVIDLTGDDDDDDDHDSDESEVLSNVDLLPITLANTWQARKLPHHRASVRVAHDNHDAIGKVAEDGLANHPTVRHPGSQRPAAVNTPNGEASGTFPQPHADSPWRRRSHGEEISSLVSHPGPSLQTLVPPEDHLQTLEGMGFTTARAKQALQHSAGNLVQALDWLCGDQDHLPTTPDDSSEDRPSERKTSSFINAPIFPGMTEPYRLPSDATSCPVDGCPRKGREPPKLGKSSLHSRLREHMKRHHGWPRGHGTKSLQSPPRDHPSEHPQSTNTTPSSTGKLKNYLQHAPVFPGMADPYVVPDNASTCLIKGCPKRGLPPPASGGNLQARVHEHMKRHHGWPRTEVPPSPTQVSESVDTISNHVLIRGIHSNRSPSISIDNNEQIGSEINHVPEAAASHAGSKRTYDGFVKSAVNSLPNQAETSLTESNKAKVDFITTQKNLPGLLEKHGNGKTKELVLALYSLPQYHNGDIRLHKPFGNEEDALIKHLKEDLNLKWDVIRNFFPHRPSWMTIQSHYSQKLSRGSQMSKKRIEQIRPQASSAGEESTDSGFLEAAQRRSRRAAANIPQGLYRERPPSALPRAGLPVDENERTERPPSPVIKATTECTTNTASTMNKPVATRNLSRRPMEIGSNACARSGVQAVDRERNSAALSSMTAKISRHLRKSIDVTRPYLAQEERTFLQRSPGIWSGDACESWDGAVIHVDFIDEELDCVEKWATRIRMVEARNSTVDKRRRIQKIMSSATDEELERIASGIISDVLFLNRSLESIRACLQDMARAEISASSTCLTLQMPSKRDWARKLRGREIGTVRHNQFHETFDMLGPRLRFKGTSSDVNVLSWAPDGNHFVVGSSALTDESSMQYNRSNNLLFGNVADGTLRELVGHATKRHAESGVNSRAEMMASQDPFIFHSISAAEFSPDGGTMITAGYDNTAVVWDTTRETPEVKTIYSHYVPIDVMCVGTNGLFATGSKSVLDRLFPAIRILRYNWIDSVTMKVRKYNSQRGRDLVEPACLRFGPAWAEQDKYLLGGFCSYNKDYGSGEVNIWDVTRGSEPIVHFTSTNVFDAVWNPAAFGTFAVGYSGGHGSGLNKGTRSVVRVFDSFRTPEIDLHVRRKRAYELECPALDMNDLIYCPNNTFLISAGCTDGRVYTWDLRNPNEILHTFEHAPPIAPHSSDELRERIDTGVRFLSWGQGGRHLYSGSSDGVVAAWDPYRAAEDAHVRDVARLDTGVMSGAFSPDYTDLLLGDIYGSVSLLSVGHDLDLDLGMGGAAQFTLVEDVKRKEELRREHSGPLEAQSNYDNRPEGATAAQVLLASGQVELRPFGNLPIRQAVQGPAYTPLRNHTPTDEDVAMHAAAGAFQAELRLHEAEPPCVCAQSTLLLTEEELGDSGAWRVRIPAELRFGKPESAESSSSTQLRSLTVYCQRCEASKLARHGDTTAEGDAAENDVYACPECKAAWQVNVLGYQAVSTHEPRPRQRLLRRARYGTHDRNEKARGSKSNGLEFLDREHYHSMWGQKS